jgi:hypothetical protein
MLATIDLSTIRATLDANGGFTLDPRTGRLLTVGEDSGFAIAVAGTEQIIGDALTEEGFRNAFTAAMETVHPVDIDQDAVFIGGWRAPERGYMIELTKVHHVSRASAILLGVLHDQDAIFDIATGEEIETRPFVVSL